MFRRRWLRPIRGEVNKKMGEANSEKNDIFKLHERNRLQDWAKSEILECYVESS